MAENIPGKGEGWDWFKRTERSVEESRNEDGFSREDMYQLYERCFNTRAGKAVLNDLLRFRRAQVFDPTLGFYDGAALGFYNTGIVHVVTHIERMVLTGRSRRAEG